MDTNALSAAAGGVASMEPILRGASLVAIPVIVLGEYRYGIQQSRNREQHEFGLAESIRGYRILEINEETTKPYAAIRGELKRAGTPIPSNDVWIAALCRQHKLPLLSQDKHFDLVRGLRRIDW